MSLTAADVAEIMKLVEQSSFDELTLEMDGVKLSLKRGGGTSAGSLLSSTPSGAGAPSVASQAASVAGAQPAGTGAGASASSGATHLPQVSKAAAEAARAAGGGAAVSAPASSDPNVHDVPSPLLGTFYRSPKPGAPPFVEVGSKVEEETVVGIIEVMKLMNTVRAGVRGTVAEILPADGTLVEYDQPILRIRKAG